jgi:hypothetical protein
MKTEIPPRMRKLDRDPRGYPIPWGVLRDQQGRAHFTVNDEGKRVLALLESLCPICGGKMPARRFFVGGPRSAFDDNGAYNDPPMHGECMRYALRTCPYLAAPSYGRRIDAATVPAGEPERIYIDRTMIAERPVLFVAVLSIGQTVQSGRFTVKPTKPYLLVEYWRHGKRLTESEGSRIAQEAIRAPLPALAAPRLVRVGKSST